MRILTLSFLIASSLLGQANSTCPGNAPITGSASGVTTIISANPVQNIHLCAVTFATSAASNITLAVVLPAAITISTTNSSNVVTASSTAGLIGGGRQAIAASGIPSGTTITSIVGTSLTLSANATATATGVSIAVSASGPFQNVGAFDHDWRGDLALGLGNGFGLNFSSAVTVGGTVTYYITPQ